MKHRAERKDVYEQVKIDTKEVCKQFGFRPEAVELMADTSTISHSMLQTINDLGMEFAKDKEEVKEALSIAETDDDYLLCMKHWIGRLLLSGKILGDHHYRQYGRELFARFFGEPTIMERPVLEANIFAYLDGDLFTIQIMVSRYCEDTLDTRPVYKKSYSGKPSRVIGKIFGEKFVTHMCQHYPIKSNKCELHFARHFIPELYQYIAKDESQTSCMSKNSDQYDLPDHFHPVMPYEGSPNAALALLWDTFKGRYVARAIVNLDNMAFNASYGVSGNSEKFKQTGLNRSYFMEGMLINKIKYEGELLVPYVDGNTQRLSHYCDNYLVVDCNGDIEGSYETGREIVCHECPCCGETYTEEGESTEDGYVCSECFNNSYYYINSENEYVHESHLVYCQWAEEYYRNDRERICIETPGGLWNNIIYVVEENLSDFLRHTSDTIISIDGMSYGEWLEQAA